MTNQQAIQAELQNIVVTDDAIEKAMIDYVVNGSDTYAPENGAIVARCTIQVLQAMLGSLDIQEGGYAITMRSTVIPQRIAALARKWGFTDLINQALPTIKAVSRW